MDKVKRDNVLSILALFASLFAFAVIGLGAFTRLIDAGLGCPDWPGCYGHLAVPLMVQDPNWVAYKAWAEMIHRYFVGGLSFFILVIIGMIFFQKKNRSLANSLFAVGLMVLLGYQIMLGRWTVTLKLLPIIVTQHLLGGFLILSTLWMIYLNNRSSRVSFVMPVQQLTVKKYLPWALIAFLLLLMQISLGAWTSTNYASLSCPDFPLCQNDQSVVTLYFKEAFNIFSPGGVNYEGGVLSDVVRQTIQMTHRMGALVLSIYLFVFVMLGIQKFSKIPHLQKSFYLIMALLIIQLCLGMANIIFKLPLVSAICHNLVAVLLLLSIITLIFKMSTIGRKVTNV